MRVNSGLQTLIEQEKQGGSQPSSGFAAMLRAAATKAQVSQAAQEGAPVSGATQADAPLADVNITDEMREQWESYGQGFGVFMVCQMLWGVDTTRPINVESKGNQTLTDEQAAELMEKYDVKNLTPQERYDLLCDLTEMEVLSVADLGHIVLRKPILNVGVLIPVGSDVYNPYEHRVYTNMDNPNFYAYMRNTVQNNNMEYEYMLAIGRDPKASEGQMEGYRKFMGGREAIDDMMASHQKLFDLLSRLAR